MSDTEAPGIPAEGEVPHIGDIETDLSGFDLPDDIVGIDEYTENITMLLYGPPGIGKTRLAGTARSLILAVEKGTVSAKKTAGPGAKVWPCPAWPNFERAYEWLKANAAKPGFPFDWVVIDTGTQLQLDIRKDIVEERVELKGGSVDKVQLEEYGEDQMRLMRFVTLVNDLPVNVLWTAHEMMGTTPEGEELRLPQFHGKKGLVANWVAAQMHCVGYMHFADVQFTSGVKRARVIQWNGTENIIAKDRFDCLGGRNGFTVGKNLQQLTDMILAANAVETDK